MGKVLGVVYRAISTHLLHKAGTLSRKARDAVLHGKPFPNHVDDAVANLRVIDACYRAAGLAPRQGTMT